MVTSSLSCVHRLPWRHPVLLPISSGFQQEVIAWRLPWNHRSGRTALSEGWTHRKHAAMHTPESSGLVMSHSFCVCICVAEGAGPLLWLRVLPSGARQIPEERILPEGERQYVKRRYNPINSWVQSRNKEFTWTMKWCGQGHQRPDANGLHTWTYVCFSHKVHIWFAYLPLYIEVLGFKKIPDINECVKQKSERKLACFTVKDSVVKNKMVIVPYRMFSLPTISISWHKCCFPLLQSLVLISKLPYVTFFHSLLKIMAPEYFEKQEPCLEAGQSACLSPL